MRKLMTIFVVSLGLLIVNCSTLTISTDYDRQADFRSYRTFDWIPQPKAAVGGARAAMERNPLLDKRIKGAVTGQLIAKGYRQEKKRPDLLLAYHTGIKDKVNVTDWGYGYGAYWRYPSGRVEVYQYQEGTLILDMVDAKKKELVWRGTAQKAITTTASPEEREQNLNKVVAKLLANFPPK